MKFITTNELGRLTKWLRILGFDVIYFVSGNRSELILRSLRQERIILTRDSRMSPQSGIRLIRIRGDNLKEQLHQVIDELDIEPDEEKLFTRCVICNQALQQVEKPDIVDRVPDYVYNTQTLFVQCPECKRVYWQGTHWGNVRNLLEEVRS